MLTPEYLSQITESAEDMTVKLRENIVCLMAERYVARMKRGEENKIIPSDRALAETLQAAGLLYQEVVKLVRNYMGESDQIVREIFRDAGVKALRFENEAYLKAGLSDDGSHMSPASKRVINRNYKATNGTMQNITGTLANESQRTFINVCSQSLFEIQNSAKSLSQAYLDAIKKIVKEGGYIEYDSGRRDTVETAVLRALRTGLTQTSAEITIERAGETGYDLVLVSAHLGARVNPGDKIADHAGWQGKVYSVSGKSKEYDKLEDDTGYPSNPLGLCGYNCRHNITIFIPGVSQNPYRDKKGNLIINGEIIDSEKNKKKYEDEQKARQMERVIRGNKIKKKALQTVYDSAGGEEKEEIGKELKNVRERLKLQNKEYRALIDETDLKPLDYRVKVAPRDIENKTIVNETKSAKIELTDNERYALNSYLSFESYGINEKLRTGIELSMDEKTMLTDLDCALNKIPFYEGDLSRSLYFDDEENVQQFLSILAVGKEIRFLEYISTTSSCELYNPDGEIQILLKGTTRGRDLRGYNSEESEVLYERGSLFEVTNILCRDGKYIIIMKEV